MTKPLKTRSETWTTKWPSSAKVSKTVKCTAKSKTGNFGHQSTHVKALNTSRQTNTTIPTTIHNCKHNRTKSSQTNVPEREMDRNRQFFGRFLSWLYWGQISDWWCQIITRHMWRTWFQMSDFWWQWEHWEQWYVDSAGLFGVYCCREWVLRWYTHFYA